MTSVPVAATTIDSPLGPLTLEASPSGLTRILFDREISDPLPPGDDVRCGQHLQAAARQLREYFAGERREFDLALDAQGTDFDRLTWSELRRIPYGTTISYGELARRVGRPGAARAVGHANGRNPLAIVIPCHRVVATGGGLGGYAGGLDVKRALLALEGAAPETLPGVRMTRDRTTQPA